MRSILIEYDKNYGFNKRAGYSMAIDGSYVSEFEKYLIVAIFKGFKRWLKWDKEYR
jgi:hypothetical protein